MEQVSPWTQVVSLLSDVANGNLLVEQPCRASPFAQRTICIAAPRNRENDRSNVGRSSKVTCVELQVNKSALVSWCDSTMCHYIDQVWRQAIARSPGYCALTGQRIERGTLVFKPRTCGRARPANCDEMILVSAVALIDE